MQVPQCVTALQGCCYTRVQWRTEWGALWSLGGLNCFQHDHREENADLCLERVSELGHEGEKDAAGQGKGLWNGGGAVLQQTEAQILLDGRAELLACSEHLSTVLEQYHQQLKGQNLHEPTSHGIAFTYNARLLLLLLCIRCELTRLHSF